MSLALALPPELTIYTVNELRPVFSNWAAQQSDTLILHADAASEIDAAGIQLLLSMSKTMKAKGGQLALVNANPKLTAACNALGVASLLDLTDAGDSHER